MKCKTLERFDENGQILMKPKKQFDTLDEAIAEAKKMNLLDTTIHKLIAYKCDECFKYHIGRGKTEMTEKYKSKLQKEKSINKTIEQSIKESKKPKFKIVGHIDLDKIKY
jgi:hypothetical protein